MLPGKLCPGCPRGLPGVLCFGWWRCGCSRKCETELSPSTQNRSKGETQNFLMLEAGWFYGLRIFFFPCEVLVYFYGMDLIPPKLLLSLGPGIFQGPNLLCPLWCPAGDHRSLFALRSVQMFSPFQALKFHFPCGTS